MSQKYNIQSSDNLSKRLVAKGEIKEIHRQTSSFIGCVYTYDLFFSVKIDSKDERVRIMTTLQKYSVEDKDSHGQGKTSRSEETISMYNEEKVHKISCLKMLYLIDNIIKALNSDDNSTNYDDNW